MLTRVVIPTLRYDFSLQQNRFKHRNVQNLRRDPLKPHGDTRHPTHNQYIHHQLNPYCFHRARVFHLHGKFQPDILIL
uniref:Uncharacterized protein n=1 Tax=Human betaherpesvirus 6 TaxID=10368 RepID=A0A1W6G136_9BETA|nr:hypothetical protein [Human betaherpesvirus 6]